MMKKNILLLLTISLSSLVLGQVKLGNKVQLSIIDQNPFLDVSNYSTFDEGRGKGLYFPQTDLTTFKFNTSRLDGVNTFLTAFDGMVVYNTVKGKTGGDVDTQGIQVDVEPGFYYFSNPDNENGTTVKKGKWVRIMDTSELSKEINNGKFWTLKGNEGITEVTLEGPNDEGKDPNKIKSGNFIGTTDAKSLTFATDNIPRLTIGATGEISEQVGDNTEPFKFVLKVYGKAKFDKGLVTSASTYPDYVFDNYFTGKSDVNPDYKFKKLNEVEAFIKENNHLPGVTKIDDLAKTESGYEVDNTQLSIQTLEKVEELYLHLIEQQKEIQALKAQIAELKK